MILIELIDAHEVVNGANLRPTGTNERIDYSRFAPHVTAAMRAFVRDLMGEAMYSDMCAKRGQMPCNYNSDLGPLVPAFPPPDTEKYEILFQMFLYELAAIAVVHQYLPFSVFKLGNTGLVTTAAHGVNPATIADAKFMQQTYKARIDDLQKGFINYMQVNSTDYPLFKNKALDKDINYTPRKLGLVFYRKNEGFRPRYNRP